MALSRCRLQLWSACRKLNTNLISSGRNYVNKARRTRVSAIKVSGGILASVFGGVACLVNLPEELLLESEEEVQKQIPDDYDANALESYWSCRPLAVTARFLDIIGKIGPYLLRTVYEYQVRGVIRHDISMQAQNGAQLRTILTELGPCFIKMGQVSPPCRSV